MFDYNIEKEILATAVSVTLVTAFLIALKKIFNWDFGPGFKYMANDVISDLEKILIAMISVIFIICLITLLINDRAGTTASFFAGIFLCYLALLLRVVSKQLL